MKSLKYKRITKAIIASIATASLHLSIPVQAQAEGLPSFFDWRYNNPTDSSSGFDEFTIVPSVKNQDPFGTCWSFASIGSYESSWMAKLKNAAANGANISVAMPNFSERYLAWMAYADAKNDTENLGLYYPKYSGNKDHPVYDNGGYALMATNTWLRKGVVWESESPYQQFNDDYNTIIKEVKAAVTAEANANGWSNKTAEEVLSQRLTEAYRARMGYYEYGEVENTITPTGSIHDAYEVSKFYDGVLEAEDLEEVKSLIADNGVIYMAMNSKNRVPFNNYGEWYSTEKYADHAQTLVGWDDNYIFKTTDENGNQLQGAFIIRNSWSTDMGINGYGYISYKDASLQEFTFFNAETDPMRYTINANNAPTAINGINFAYYADDGTTYDSQPIAASFNASQHQFLKGVMLYASSHDMKYDIVVREGSTPGEGKILAMKSGTFGEDGTPNWAGYRTVDLDGYVLLPKDKYYVVEVTTTSPDGSSAGVALQADEDGKLYEGYEGKGKSYFYNNETGKWSDAFEIDWSSVNGNNSSTARVKISEDDLTIDDNPTGYIDIDAENIKLQNVHIFLVARSKETSSANGGDFTVTSLDDSDTDGSAVINLGSANELYGTDALNPDRRTLSNMTVDLASGVQNHYFGSIIGEGSVTKTGLGTLNLYGTNTYTGGTTVNNGFLFINGSILGNAVTEQSGVLGGSGSIAGTLYNYNSAVAGNNTGYGNLTVGALESRGTLISQGFDNKFIVNGNANIDGSTFLPFSQLPDDTTTVLTANSITGTPANTAENPAEVSGLMSATANVDGNEVNVSTFIQNNANANNTVFNAMNNIYYNLDDARREEMRLLYNLPNDYAKSALEEISSSGATEMMSLAQQNDLIDYLVTQRLRDTDTNNFWVKYNKNWGKMRHGDYHANGVSGGYEWNKNNWRYGFLVSYDALNYSGTNTQGNVYDTRFGLYAGHNKGANDYYLYLDHGIQRNKLNRAIPTLGLGANAKYDSHITEIGGGFKHDLQPQRIWHVSPFIKLQASYMHNQGYSEKGAGIFNQKVSSKNNTYFAPQIGLELRRDLKRGSYAMSLGVKQTVSGAEPKLNFSYEGDASRHYRLHNTKDKTHFIFNIKGENDFGHGWSLLGDARFQKGRHDHDVMASLTLNKSW